MQKKITPKPHAPKRPKPAANYGVVHTGANRKMRRAENAIIRKNKRRRARMVEQAKAGEVE